MSAVAAFPHDGWYWASTQRMTVGVRVEGGLVVDCAPVVRRFVGQPAENLARWLRRQGGFEVRLLRGAPVNKKAWETARDALMSDEPFDLTCPCTDHDPCECACGGECECHWKEIT